MMIFVCQLWTNAGGERNGASKSFTSQGNSRATCSSKSYTRSTVLISFILKFNVFWVLFLGRSNCIFLGDFVQELPKGEIVRLKSQQKGQR